MWPYEAAIHSGSRTDGRSRHPAGVGTVGLGTSRRGITGARLLCSHGSVVVRRGRRPWMWSSWADGFGTVTVPYPSLRPRNHTAATLTTTVRFRYDVCLGQILIATVNLVRNRNEL